MDLFSCFCLLRLLYIQSRVIARSLYKGVSLLFLLKLVVELLPFLLSDCMSDMGQIGESLWASVKAFCLVRHLQCFISFLIPVEAYVSLYSMDLYRYSSLYHLLDSDNEVSC